MRKNYAQAVLLRIGVIALSVVLCIVGVSIFSNRLASEASLVSKSRTFNLLGTRSSESLAKLKSDQQKAESTLATINSFLPNQYELFKFPDWAERAGQTQGVVVNGSVQIGSLFLLNDPLGYAPMGLIISGDSAKVFSYLKFIEGNNGQYLIAIDSVDVTNPGNASGTITINTQGKLLFKKQ